MAEARTPRGRLRQVERWLIANHPTALPVRVRVCELKSDLWGMTRRHPKYFTVTIAKLILPVGYLPHEVLIHEWAHAFAWRPHLEDTVFEVHHDDEWAIAYGKIYRAYFEDGGEDDSMEFSPSPWT